jgi:hypothetical protein
MSDGLASLLVWMVEPEEVIMKQLQLEQSRMTVLPSTT